MSSSSPGSRLVRRRAERRKRAIRRVLAAAVVLVVIGVGLWLGRDAFSSEDPGTPAETSGGSVSPEPTDEPEPTPEPEPEPEPVVFSLMMAGDVLPHATVLRNAEVGDGTYDFVPMMEPVREFIEGADLALCSLEVPLAPEGETPSAYPVFGAPVELLSSLKEVGWDGCATATNHALDRREPGLFRTIDAMDEVGLGRTGTGRDAEEAASAQFYEVEKDGVAITVAHLSATTFHNDYTDTAQFSSVLHGLTDANGIIDLARQARVDGADIVVFTPHWGQEYWKEPDGLQESIASDLAASGLVDVVLGGHAHVPQPLVKLPGGVRGNGMWVAYSMGNFLSNQDEKCCNVSTSTGMMPRVTIVAEGDDVTVDDVTWSGAMVDTDGRQRLYPIQALLDGERPEGITLNPDRIRNRWNAMTAILGTEQYDPEPPGTDGSGGAAVTVIPREES